MINIELNIDLVAENRALDSDVEYRAENRAFIQLLNTELNKYQLFKNAGDCLAEVIGRVLDLIYDQNFKIPFWKSSATNMNSGCTPFVVTCSLLCNVHESCCATQVVLCDLGWWCGILWDLRHKRVTHDTQCDLGHVIGPGLYRIYFHHYWLQDPTLTPLSDPLKPKATGVDLVGPIRSSQAYMLTGPVASHKVENSEAASPNFLIHILHLWV